MTTVLAAIDSSPAARPVLETSLGISALTGATVEAIHVRDNSGETPAEAAARCDVLLRLVDGDVDTALLSAIAEPDVLAVVVGARGTPGGRRPVGRTALHILERASKPVVVVPPEAVGVSLRPFRHLLVPLEGSEESARPIAEMLRPLIVADIELVVLHVFTTSSVPPVLDHPEWDLPLWGDEFLARFCPAATRIDLRTGAVGSAVTEACGELDVDLIVLSWSQDASPGHAAVVRDVLARSSVPVLLLPVEAVGTAGADPPSISARRR